jgi:hypothetical protein
VTPKIFKLGGEHPGRGSEGHGGGGMVGCSGVSGWPDLCFLVLIACIDSRVAKVLVGLFRSGSRRHPLA